MKKLLTTISAAALVALSGCGGGGSDYGSSYIVWPNGDVAVYDASQQAFAVPESTMTVERLRDGLTLAGLTVTHNADLVANGAIIGYVRMEGGRAVFSCNDGRKMLLAISNSRPYWTYNCVLS